MPDLGRSTFDAGDTRQSTTVIPATFHDYVGQPNFMLDDPVQPVFASLILGELIKRSPAGRVLDIGCGRGIGRRRDLMWNIKNHASELWGIEPDSSVAPETGLFDHHQHALLEGADLPAAYFDLAFAVFVVEHVTNPASFMAGVARALKPGGVFLFVTPNGGAFFGRVSTTLQRLRLDEFALAFVRGKKTAEKYHYPLAMRMNRPKDVIREAVNVGFEMPEFAFFQFDGLQGYFPCLTRWLYRLLIWRRRVFGNPASLDTMVCRAKKEMR